MSTPCSTWYRIISRTTASWAAMTAVMLFSSRILGERTGKIVWIDDRGRSRDEALSRSRWVACSDKTGEAQLQNGRRNERDVGRRAGSWRRLSVPRKVAQATEGTGRRTRNMATRRRNKEKRRWKELCLGAAGRRQELPALWKPRPSKREEDLVGRRSDAIGCRRFRTC